MVLLKENQTPTYSAVIGSIPKSKAIHHPINEVTSTCILPAINAVFPRSLIIFGLSSIPTINNRKLIPKLPNDSKLVFP